MTEEQGGQLVALVEALRLELVRAEVVQRYELLTLFVLAFCVVFLALRRAI